MFSGGALEQMSIFALGIMPYISASIILQLLTVVIPKLEQIQKEGEMGRRRLNQYTRYGCVVLSLIQSFFIARWLEVTTARTRSSARWSPIQGGRFRLLTMISLTTGTAFIMWLGEQITERGIGNGISLIIFAGIVTDMPDAAVRMFSKAKTGDITAFDLAVIGVLIVLVVAVIIFFERGQRRIPVQYAKRVVGRKIVRRPVEPPAAEGQHRRRHPADLRVVDPDVPAADRVVRADALDAADLGGAPPGRLALQPALRRPDRLLLLLLHGGHVQPGRRRRQHEEVRRLHPRHPARASATAAYINKVLTRITFGGAVYISAICVLPSLLHEKMKVPFYFGGTGLMIVVGVALDTVQQIESHLITRNYEGFTGPRGPRIRGRGGRGTGAVSS